jgi:probable rRNA maturation factor
MAFSSAESAMSYVFPPAPIPAIPVAGSDSLFAVRRIFCVARNYAAQHDHQFAEELTLYLVHGYLHLAGYDDLHPDKKRFMRRAEARALKLLAEADAIPTFAWKR